MKLRDEILVRIKERTAVTPSPSGRQPTVFRVGDQLVNVRAANEKASGHYWFDATPSYFTKAKGVDYFVFTCGTVSTAYVIPADALKELIDGASLGGSKQVPQFTIYPSTDEIEPSGLGGVRKSIRGYLNRFDLLVGGGDPALTGAPEGDLAGLEGSDPDLASLAGPSDFDAASVLDARERTLRQVVLRRGQPEFREQLLAAYGRRCAVTGCEVEEALEAAHIHPYRGEQTNSLQNGLLLRADLHTLFDRRLITVDSQTWTIVLAPSLRGTACYGDLHDRRVRLPADERIRPSAEALNYHRRAAGF